MSSAKSFRFEDRLIDKSFFDKSLINHKFMQTKRSKRCNIDHCSTSAWTSAHGDNCPFKNVFCFLEFN